MSDSMMRQHFQRSLVVAGQTWRNKIALRGLFAVIAGLALAAAAAIPFMDASHFEPVSVGIARAVLYSLLLALLCIFIVVRVPRSRDRRRLVDHLESHPAGAVDSLRRDAVQVRDTLLLTALQMDDTGANAPLDQRLYQRAAVVCDDPCGRTSADRNGARRAARALIGLGALLAIILFILGDGAIHGVKLLLMPWRDAQQGMPYGIDVQPGDTVVRERADVAISGTAQGFAPQALTLVYRSESATTWSRTPMQAMPQDDAHRRAAMPAGGVFHGDLVAVAGPFEYYLEGENVRSPTHRVRVHWLPRAQRIDHVYHYPSYTGIADRRVESATDIDAVTGSIVDVRVLADVPADTHSSAAQVRGDLVLDNSTRRALARDGDMLSASLSVDEAASYRIELRVEGGLEIDDKMVAVTPDHGITARVDGAPVVKVRRPASDARVTAIEEITVQLQADDDVSLRQVELVYSVNGRPEEVVALAPEPAARLANAAAPSSISASHTLYLEQFNLQPGDVISYHARARDGVVARTAVSDIRFLEVRPFDRDYRRGRAGSGGGAGGRNQESLAAQQRDLVVALFRLARDSQQLPAEEQAQRLTTLSDAQGRIRGRVQAIVRRIEGRAVVQNTPGYALMLEVMPKAVTAMARVEALLTVPDADQSLPFAREALAHLQRADASFREVQVASQRGRGGGGGGRMNNNDLSRLFELEMDRFRNRYSQVQRAQAPQHQREVDETLDKLKELARRQREEVERARRRAQRGSAPAGNGSPGSSAGNAATQRALAAALDELLRRLERLSREQPSASMDAARLAMQQAAQSMRESARSQQNTQPQARSTVPSDKPGSTQQSGQRGKQQGEQHSAGADASQGDAQAMESSGERSARDALRRLDAARQALTADGRDQISREVREAQHRVQSLLRHQALIAQQLSDGGRPQSVAQGARSAGDDQSTRLARAQGQARAGNLSADDTDQGQGQATGRKRSDGAIDARSAGRRDADDDGDGDDDSGRSVDELKASMQADAQKLGEQLDRIASAKDIGALVRGATRRAGEVMREEDVEGRLRFSREQLAAGQSYGTLEASIAQALERVSEQIARAADAIAQDGKGRVAQGASQRRPRPNEPRKNAQREGQNGGQNVSQGNAQSSGQGPQQPAGRGGGDGRGQGQVASPGEGQISGPRSGDTSMPNAERLREMMREMARLRERFGRGLGAGGRGGDDLRGLASELSQFEAGQLEAQASNFGRAGDLRTLIEGIEALVAHDTAGNMRGAAVGDALLAALARVEQRVKDQAEAGRPAVPAGRDSRMPREYRALVEAYYRRLSAAEPRR